MRRIVPNCRETIYLGRLGENEATVISFPLSMFSDFESGGHFALINQRSTDASAYPVVVSVTPDAVDWVVSSADVAVEGYGKCELMYYIGDTIAKSYIFDTVTLPALDGTGEVPEPWQSWVDQVEGYANSAQESATAAARSASDAHDDAVTASQKADDASRSATDADRSARDASGYATEASGYATDASGYASQAQAFASAAEGSATAADRSERDATAAAQTATEAAGLASGYATDASNAKRDAETAKRDAQNAQTAAELAQDKAEDAQHAIENMTATASTLPEGSTATVTKTEVGGVVNLAFGIPKGDTGATGATPDFGIGTVETLPEGSQATASITGTPESPLLNLGIPKGDTGEVSNADLWAILPTDSASGAIASFTDGADNVPMDSVVCDIVPVQSGSGDPSPTNVRAITGFTGLTLTKTGANLLDTSRIELGTFSQSTGEPISGSGNQQRTTYYIKVNAGQKIINTNSKSENNRAFFFLGSTYISTAVLANNTPTTVPSGVDRVYISSTASGWTGSTAPTWAQIEIGATATPYTAYNGTNYPVSWQTEAGTVYGGSLDVTTGVLTVDTQRFVMDGTTRKVTYTSIASGYRLFLGLSPRRSIAGVGTADKPYLSNIFKMKYTAGAGQAYMGGGNGDQITMYFVDQTIDNLDDANDWLAEHQPEFVVALATPVTYQLTPTEIASLLGANNLWCDTGDISASYKADIKLYIDKKTALNNRGLMTAPTPTPTPQEEPEER